jgi:hypothetical protein
VRLQNLKAASANGECDGVKDELKNFIVLYPYLKTLSKIIKKPFYSYSVIESYWLGNDELKKAKQLDYLLLLENFKKQGVPDFFVEESKILKNLKNLFLIIYSTCCMLVLEKPAGQCRSTLETINNCMIRWGKVQSLTKKEAVVELNSIKGSRVYSLTKNKERIPFNSRFTPELKVGDIVAVHWNMIVKALNIEEEKNLTFWTNKVLAEIV